MILSATWCPNFQGENGLSPADFIVVFGEKSRILPSIEGQIPAAVRS
jgi:hypothetical protein